MVTAPEYVEMGEWMESAIFTDTDSELKTSAAIVFMLWFEELQRK